MNNTKHFLSQDAFFLTETIFSTAVNIQHLAQLYN